MSEFVPMFLSFLSCRVRRICFFVRNIRLLSRRRYVHNFCKKCMLYIAQMCVHFFLLRNVCSISRRRYVHCFVRNLLLLSRRRYYVHFFGNKCVLYIAQTLCAFFFVKYIRLLSCIGLSDLLCIRNFFIGHFS